MGCEVVTIANNPYPDQVVLAADQLKMLNVAFTGIDHVGLEACRAKGVQICNAANYSNQTVAELVIGMTIDLLRHMDEAQQRVHGGGTAAGLTGREIMGKTVGIIGTGRIGMITAKLFLAFGAKVIAYSRTEKPEAKALGITYLPLADVMAQSDIVSIHTPNNASTCGLISAEMIALMKPTALLINCARGPIVDSAALAAALNEGRLAGAGVDVAHPGQRASAARPQCPADSPYRFCFSGIHDSPRPDRLPEYRSLSGREAGERLPVLSPLLFLPLTRRANGFFYQV